MKQILFFFLALSMVISVAQSQEAYLVEEGDILSQIVLRKYPNPDFKLYGNDGKLKEVLELNPQLKNPNSIKPKQAIYLAKPDPVEIEKEEKVSLEMTPTTATIPAPLSQGQWDLSGHYGVKGVSYSQKQTMGNVNVGAVFPSYYQLAAEYSKDSWAGWLNTQSFNLNYQSGRFSQSRQIRSYEVGASYKNVLMVLSLDENPLFRETTTRVEMYKYEFINIGVGWRDHWIYKSSLLNFKSSLKYSLAGDAENSSVNVSSPRALQMNAQLQWQYPLFKAATYQVYGDWQNDIRYQKGNFKIKWAGQSGLVHSNISEFSSSLGLHLKF